jgi:hypothetical protein
LQGKWGLVAWQRGSLTEDSGKERGFCKPEVEGSKKSLFLERKGLITPKEKSSLGRFLKTPPGAKVLFIHFFQIL